MAWDILSTSLPFVGGGLLASSFLMHWLAQQPSSEPMRCAGAHALSALWPRLWIVVKGRKLRTLQAALGLRNPQPCSWPEGLASTGRVFLAGPIKGWILVTGPALPDPTDEVDDCFHSVCRLSREVGQVQLFCVNSVLGHHGWIKAKGGRIVRAYVWAGTTVWSQGALTPEEQALHLKCFDYAQNAQALSDGEVAAVRENCERVKLLAGQWSVDVANLEPFLDVCGIIGELRNSTRAGQ